MPVDTRTDFLHKKAGPLTGLQWALVIGGAIGLYLLYKKRKAAAGGTAGGGGQTTTDQYGDVFGSDGSLLYAAPGGPYGGAALSTGGGGGAAGIGGTGGTGTSTSPLKYLTNSDWITAAYNDLVGHGYDPAASLAALTNYVSSQPLSQQQTSILDAALAYAGSPPNAVPPVTQPVTTPTATTPAAPSAAPPPIDLSAFYALSQPAAQNLLASGQVGYQSGAEAIQWAQAHGGSTTGIVPSQYYALSPQAARALVASGNPLYQSGAEAQAWATAHPNG